MTMLQRLFFRFDLPLLMLMLVGLALAGCEMSAPSQINVSPIEVREQPYNDTIPVGSFSADTAKLIGENYRRFGQGPVDVTVTYAAGASETKAKNQAARVAGLLRGEGVADVVVSTLPVNDRDQVDQLMLNYVQVSAHPPRECGDHPADTRADIAGNENGRVENYRFGCGIDTYIAQQVARPKDLAGTDTLAPATADRYSNALKGYRDGKDYKKLDSKNASETKL